MATRAWSRAPPNPPARSGPEPAGYTERSAGATQGPPDPFHPLQGGIGAVHPSRKEGGWGGLQMAGARLSDPHPRPSDQAMRAEIESLHDAAKQSIGLLRRHL